MAVSIRFFGMQRQVTETDSIAMPVKGGTRVTDALDYVRSRYPDLPLEEGMVLIAVNDEMATLDTPLRADDTIAFLPHIGGG